MAKKIKGMERSSRRQYIKVDNIKQIVAQPNERKSTKSATGNKYHNPSQEKSSKREHQEPRPEKQNVTMTSTELLHSISGGIIKSGIKYIMFPLHFMRFCIFGTDLTPEKLTICDAGRGSKNSGSSSKKTNKKEQENMSSKSKDNRQAKNDEASNRKFFEESLRNIKSGSSRDTRNAGSSLGTDTKEVCKEHDEGLLERPLIVVVEEDSDSSSDRWSTASSTMIENVSMDIDRSISFDSLVEPMDVSIEKYTYERSQIVMESREKQHSTLSLDSEMARIFQKYCTSSDDEYSSSNTLSEKGERPGGKNFLCHAETSHSGATVPLKSKEKEVNKEQKKKTSFEEVDKERNKKTSEKVDRERKKKTSEEVAKEQKKKTSEEIDKERKKKTSEEIDKERKKKTSEEVDKEQKKKTSEEVDKERKKKVSSEDVTHHKRRKVSQEEDRPQKQRDRKSDTKRREQKQSSKLYTRNKSKTQSPKTLVKSKQSKRKDVEYKETATQTDSAFSDDDVEMIPVDAKLPERRNCCKHAVFRSHPNLYLYRGVGHDFNYVADNEDSNDGFARIARKRVSSSSTSSSSTDLGFDEQGISPESDIGTGQWHANAHDTITSHRTCSRAPPGFPQRPQNPPLLSYMHTDWYKVTTTSLQNNPNDEPSTPTVVPRAPAPMRHLYYDYPEFMDLPTTANSSNVLNILRENYNR